MPSRSAASCDPFSGASHGERWDASSGEFLDAFRHARGVTCGGSPMDEFCDRADYRRHGCTRTTSSGGEFVWHESSVRQYRPGLVAGPNSSGFAGRVSIAGRLSALGFCHLMNPATCSSDITLLYYIYNTSGGQLG